MRGKFKAKIRGLIDRKIQLFSLLGCFLLLPCTVHSQRLHPFTSATSIRNSTQPEEPVPYKRTMNYFDCIDPASKSLQVHQADSASTVTFELPAQVDEIGIRLISPVPQNHFPNTGDMVSDRYSPEKGKPAWFNPYMILEQWVPAGSDSSVSIIPGWRVLDENDDSDDAPSQPDGKNNNSVIRVTRGPYPAGAYRVRFGAADRGQPRGCFLLQIGTIPAMKGIMIREQQ